MTNAELIEKVNARHRIRPIHQTSSTATSPLSQGISPLRWFTSASTDSNITQTTTYSTFPPSENAEPIQRPTPEKTGTAEFSPPDTYTQQFKNFYNMLTGNMSADGAQKYWQDVDQRYSRIDCKACETNRDYLLAYSPIINYLSQNIKKLGGDLNKTNIRCRTCTTKQYGGFDHKFGIMLCANYLDSQKQTEDVLAHEMVHAYDHLRFKTNLDASETLKKLACSEIRASNLSGECRWTNEFFGNGIFKFRKQHQDCVRRRAIVSVTNRPSCQDEAAATRAVDEAWESCFTDTRPFDEIYR